MTDIYTIICLPAACLLLLIYSIIHIRLKEQLHTSAYKTFKWIAAFGLFHVVSSIAAFWLINRREHFDTRIIVFAYDVFLVSAMLVLTSLLWYLILYIQKKSLLDLSTDKIVLISAFAAAALFCILTPVGKNAFVDTEHGSYIWSTNLIPVFSFTLFVVFYTTYFFIRYFKLWVRKNCVALILSVPLLIAVIVAQIVFKHIPVTGLIATLAIAGLMLSMDNTLVILSATETLYNRNGCMDMINELLALHKPFSVGIYSFVGTVQDIKEAMMSVKKQLAPNSSSAIDCYMLMDDILLVVPNHNRKRPLPLPADLPEPVLKDGERKIHYSGRVLNFNGDMTADDIFRSLLEVRDRFTESISQRDDLTETPRRPFFIRRVEQLQCEGMDFAFIMLDLDNFKYINDTYGHQMGDYVLQRVALSLRSVLRPSDIICRMGGDEFGIVLPELTDAEIIYNRICQMRELLNPIEFNDKTFIVTFSLGLCINDAERRYATFQEVYAKADSALYHAKFDGKDRIVFAKDKTSINFR